MWAPGMGELFILLIIVLVVFGAGKLPQVGRSLGDAISEFKAGINKKNDDKDKDKETTPPEEKIS